MFFDAFEGGYAEFGVVKSTVEGYVSFVMFDDIDRVVLDGLYPVSEFFCVGDGC